MSRFWFVHKLGKVQDRDGQEFNVQGGVIQILYLLTTIVWIENELIAVVASPCRKLLG